MFEDGVRIFHPETVSFGERVYVGHDTILKGHPHGRLTIGSGTWIGQQCFIHSAGGVTIGQGVGIGPGVRILSSSHTAIPADHPVLLTPIEFGQVVIEDGVDLGAGSIVLPGTTIGAYAVVGAGAVVTKDLPPRCIAAGAPARVLRIR